MFISETPGIVVCSYDEIHKHTQHNWSTFYCNPSQSIAMRESIELFLDFVNKNHVTKHLVNVKNCTDAFSETDLEWISAYLVPKEVEYGIKYIANILSDDIFTQITTDEWQEKIVDGLIVKNFNHIEEAQAWLDSK